MDSSLVKTMEELRARILPQGQFAEQAVIKEAAMAVELTSEPS
jgi:hypothetical protein